MNMSPKPPPRSRIVELRQYTLVPGRRDELVELFDREFVSAQEDVGIHVIGQFRDLDDPDRFVWLRGFDSMAARAAALQDFYYGPVWARHRDAANATMVDSDNVLLLRPVVLGASYPWYGRRGATSAVAGLICADVYPQSAVDPEELARSGADVVGIFESAPEPNNFPQLPIRNDAAVVALTRFDASAQLAAFADAGPSGERRRLQPTARSRLR
jgi:hypothetical protein